MSSAVRSLPAAGRPVIGIDTSPAMLEQARDRAAEEDVQLDLRQADMRGTRKADSACEPRIPEVYST